jgi:hypothetical protein
MAAVMPTEPAATLSGTRATVDWRAGSATILAPPSKELATVQLFLAGKHAVPVADPGVLSANTIPLVVEVPRGSDLPMLRFKACMERARAALVCVLDLRDV